MDIIDELNQLGIDWRFLRLTGLKEGGLPRTGNSRTAICTLNQDWKPW